MTVIFCIDEEITGLSLHGDGNRSEVELLFLVSIAYISKSVQEVPLI